MKKIHFLFIALALSFSLVSVVFAQEKQSLLNASYDVSRELFEQINRAFVPYWKQKTGQVLEIKQSHNGSSRQARAILEGLPADVVTFNQITDVSVLVAGGYVSNNWKTKLPNNSSPYYSLISFLVRNGNPKGIKNWGDLVKPGVRLVFPNPKTSGNGRYTYLAAYAYAQEVFQGEEARVKSYVEDLLNNVAVFDAGGRGAATTFVENGIGDVLITFESETNGIRKQYGEDKYEVVTPPSSILAEFPVAVVDKVADRRGTTELAKGYLEFLYSSNGQEILAKNFNRIRNATVAANFAGQFPKVKLISVEQAFGSWDKAQQTHFSEGGTFDTLLASARAKR